MFSKRYGLKTGSQDERGIALLLCIFALLLLTGIALALMFMSDTETAINANYKDSQRAYFSAMAGLQEARVRLMPDPVTGAVSPIAPVTMPTSGTAGSVTYITNGNGTDVVQPWTSGNHFVDDQLCHEGFGTALSLTDTGANVPCTSVPSGYSTAYTSNDPYTGTARAMDYKWVRITWKGNLSSAPFLVANAATTAATTPICFDGQKQLPLPAGLTCESYMPLGLTTVYRVTSNAVAPGGSTRMLQMEVANNPPIITNAAVDSKDHVTLNGKLDVNGFDFCSCDTNACTTTTVGGVTTTSCPSRPGKSCDNTKWAIYSATTIDDPNKSETLVAGPNPPVVENGTWKYNIPDLIDTYKNEANTADVRKAPYNWSCTTASGVTSCGTHSAGTYGVPPNFPPNPVDQPAANPAYGTCSNGVGPGCPANQVTYIPGNTQLTGGSIGNGILIVDGDLDIHGGLQFYGLILVKGVVKFTGGGSDATNIYGAILAGEESYVDNVLGGSAVIRYNACALRQRRTPQPPTMLNFHEIAF